MARHYGKKLWLPNVPSFALKLAFGEMAQLLLKGNKVSAQKLIEEGLEFKYPGLEYLANSE
jgi:NAD dependent epimerase/dehydratase family enzyme